MARYIITNEPGEIAFENGSDEVRRIVQNARNLLLTNMGEVPYDRLRGVDPAIYHLPMEKLRTALLPEVDRALAWEPRAKAIYAEPLVNEDGETVIRVEIEV